MKWQEEQCILDTYEPDSDVNIHDVPVISCEVALQGLELPRFFRVPNRHVNLEKGEQLEGLLYREKRNIQSQQSIVRRTQYQTAETRLFNLRLDIS